MDSIFYLGLVVTFLLILLVVYHFKNRVTTMEQRCDTMFEIMNNIVQELNILRRQQKIAMGGEGPVNITTSMESNYLSQQNMQSEHYKQEDGESSSEYETDDDNSELSDDDLEEDSDDESIEKVVELTNEIIEDNNLKQIQITEETPIPDVTSSSLMEIDDNASIKIEKIDATLENKINDDSESKQESYKSMTNSALKALVIEKGLSTNPSKLKKNELLELLGELE